ncbi:hypothetical protein INS49_007178 [Diaporthe citri]|uniref:uncharacterized protein n=1 Tax=Diaporthe citri TaxID=83186 RepID=UPI001C7E5F34|nr:uncharacterized protein INS49_007178 [Diaporthe citri]KAG6365567.1 hypothetical protein INS49_007178 [Diaporthe citri]
MSFSHNHGLGPEKEVSSAATAAAVRRQLPTKHASPRRLSEELKALLGHDADFNVEVHHNVYMIESNQDFDLQTLYLNCRHTTRRGSSSTSSESD